MNKKGKETEIIHYRSEKNKRGVVLRSEAALAYAVKLEKDGDVKEYSASVSLENWLEAIQLVGISTRFRTYEWETDFVIVYYDERVAVREIIKSQSLLKKKTEIEKLEISRRYWKAQKVDDWKIYIAEKGK